MDLREMVDAVETVKAEAKEAIHGIINLGKYSKYTLHYSLYYRTEGELPGLIVVAGIGDLREKYAALTPQDPEAPIAYYLKHRRISYMGPSYSSIEWAKCILATLLAAVLSPDEEEDLCGVELCNPVVYGATPCDVADIPQKKEDILRARELIGMPD